MALLDSSSNQRVCGEELPQITVEQNLAVVSFGDFPIRFASRILTELGGRRWVAKVAHSTSTAEIQALYALGAFAVFPDSMPDHFYRLFIEAFEPTAEVSQFGLTPTEKRIFHLLQAASSDGLTRKEIYSGVWSQTHVHEKSLDVHIFNLRRKLKTHSTQIVFGDGRYRLVEGR